MNRDELRRLVALGQEATPEELEEYVRDRRFRDPKYVTSFLSNLSNAGLIELAANAVTSLLKAGLQVNVYHYSVLAAAFARRSSWERTLETLNNMSVCHGLVSNQWTFSTAVRSTGGQWQRAAGR
eukprot:s1441_g24.t1